MDPEAHIDTEDDGSDKELEYDDGNDADFDERAHDYLMNVLDHVVDAGFQPCTTLGSKPPQ